MRATPLVPSVAFRNTVTGETYQPLLPNVPERAEVDTGTVVSILTFLEWTASTSPARSVAWYSTTCCPSPRKKGPPYTDQGPLSIRYERLARPLVLSVAFRNAVTW